MSARLLIVDDEVPQMTALCEMLLLEGYQATGHHSPQQALGSLKRGDYDLLLTDLMMPAMDGVELILAARKVDPDIAGVVMTGHGTVDTAVAAMRAGALDYVLKPFRLNVILGVVHRALELRRLRLENAALQQQERENAEQLAIAYRDLETFSYSVSHDLRAPLRAIRGFTDIFFSEFGATTPPEGQRQLALIAAGAERMDRIIDDLLKFCRFSRVPIAPRRVDLHKIAERAVAELRSCEPSRQVEVRIGNLPPCEGDPSLLEQVLVNLISNAFKYTRRKPVAHIEIDGFERPVDSTGSPSEYVYFVRDNRAGFDMRFASKLFGVFQRLHSQEEFTGNGVGLSIVQRILQRHGGRIWAESTVDEGATFFFVIPVLTE